MAVQLSPYTLDNFTINGTSFDPKAQQTLIRVDDLSKPLDVRLDYHVPDAKPLYGSISLRVLCPTRDGRSQYIDGESAALERQGQVAVHVQPEMSGMHTIRVQFGSGPLFEQHFVVASQAPVAG